MRRAAPAAVVFLATFLALGFLALPVVAIFAHVSPGKLAAQLGNGVVTDALVVSLKTTLAAQALVLAVGTPAAWVLASRRVPRRSLLLTLVLLALGPAPARSPLVVHCALGRTWLLQTQSPLSHNSALLSVAV